MSQWYVLVHRTSNGAEQPNGFVSCTFTKVEQKFSEIKKSVFMYIWYQTISYLEESRGELYSYHLSVYYFILS